MDYLKKKIVILVTHQIQFIQKATKILILKEGNCLAYGSFDELQEMGIDFMSLLAKKDDDSDDAKEGEPKENSLEELSKRKESVNSETESEDSSTPVVKVAEEKAKQGTIKAKIYGEYIRASGSAFLWIVMILFTLTSQTLFHGTDLFLTYW